MRSAIGARRHDFKSDVFLRRDLGQLNCHDNPKHNTTYDRHCSKLPFVHSFVSNRQEAMVREGRSKSGERRRAEAEMCTPGPGGAGGQLSEEAHQAAAEDRQSWTGQRQRRKSEGRDGPGERLMVLECMVSTSATWQDEEGKRGTRAVYLLVFKERHVFEGGERENPRGKCNPRGNKLPRSARMDGAIVALATFGGLKRQLIACAARAQKTSPKRLSCHHHA